MTDWLKAAQSQKEEYLNDLTTLIKIPSVRNDDEATPEYPLGPAPAQALKAFLEMAEQDGFRVKNIDNVAGFAEWGEGDETLAILAHLDVMPAGKGWETDPFNPVIKDGNLYGRGVSDDKGPGMAAYYALKYLKDHGAVFKQKVRFIVGTDEENDWTGMKRYFEVEPAPTYGFSPDAEFPLINGEKGQVSLLLDIDGGNEGEVVLKHFDSGLRFNMVPRDAEATIEAVDNEAVATAFTDFLDENPITGSIESDADGIKLTVVGKAAHGMEPEKGINAISILMDFLSGINFLNDGVADFINFYRECIGYDLKGKNIGCYMADEISGDLVFNVGMIEVDKNTAKLTINVRCPVTCDCDDVYEKMLPVMTKYDLGIVKGRTKWPLFVPEDSALITTLMRIYQKHTGDTESKPIVIGGGTYARTMDNIVAFGARFPGTVELGHQKNERISIDDMMKLTKIYAEAVYELSKVKTE